MFKNKELRKEKGKGYVAIVGAFIFMVKFVLAKFGIEIPLDIIDVASSLVLGVITLWGAIRNNYLGKKGTSQYNLLKNANLD